jgi:hypothetical protein
MMGSQRRQREKPNQPKEQTVKSLQFFKPTLATTLAIVLAGLLSVRTAQAGFTVTLRQVGPDVVATGSGAIDLHGLQFSGSDTQDPAMNPVVEGVLGFAFIYTGPASSSVDFYSGGTGPRSFGEFPFVEHASTGSGNMVGAGTDRFERASIIVPKGYRSGSALSDSAIYSGQTFETLHVTPGTYVWKWGTEANQNFTLQIGPATDISNITNISTRASVQTGQEVTIGGFIITGTVPKQVVVRGLGPTLSQFGVSNFLLDPILDLHNSTSSIVTNDDWQTAANADQIPQNLRPSDAHESAILATLQPGSYTVILSGKNHTGGVGLLEVYDISSGASAELTNVSSRGFVGTGDNVMISGFIASGSTQVVVRGLGPTLAQFGVLGVLADPEVTLFDGNGNVVERNNNWRDTEQAAISATGKAPPNDLEAAILAPVAAGNYTAILSGNGGGTGIGLVEVYKLP